MWCGWSVAGGYERCLEVWTQLVGEGLQGLGNLAVGGAGRGQSGLVPEQGQVCSVWGLGSFVHSCLDSVGQQTFHGSLLCAGLGPSPAWVPALGEGGLEGGGYM